MKPSKPQDCRSRAISSENVEVVRAAFEAFDEHDLRTAADALDRDVEWDSAVLIDEEVIHGRAAVLEYWERALSTFPFVHEKIRFVETGEQVCVLADIRAVGAGSGIAPRGAARVALG